MLVAVHVLLVIMEQIIYVSNAINTVVNVPQQLFVLLAKRICCYTQTFVMMYAPMDRTTQVLFHQVIIAQHVIRVVKNVAEPVDPIVCDVRKTKVYTNRNVTMFVPVVELRMKEFVINVIKRAPLVKVKQQTIA